MTVQTKILDATCLRDGGTTCVSIEIDSRRYCLTIDYSLPWDGRPRFTYISDEMFGRDRKLEVASTEETMLLSAIRTAAVENFGSQVLENYLDGETVGNPGVGIWFYVANFLKLIRQERSSG